MTENDTVFVVTYYPYSYERSRGTEVCSSVPSMLEAVTDFIGTVDNYERRGDTRVSFFDEGYNESVRVVTKEVR